MSCVHFQPVFYLSPTDGWEYFSIPELVFEPNFFIGKGDFLLSWISRRRNHLLLNMWKYGRTLILIFQMFYLFSPLLFINFFLLKYWQCWKPNKLSLLHAIYVRNDNSRATYSVITWAINDWKKDRRHAEWKKMNR